MNTDQIAAEAADQWLESEVASPTKLNRKSLVTAFQAAIEKAVDRYLKEMEAATALIGAQGLTIKRLESRVAPSFAKATEGKHSSEDMLELAWGVIADAGGGDWTKETQEWQDAAAKWRDTYINSSAAHASEEEK